MAKHGEMREVGTIKETPLARFGRTQRRAVLVAPRAGSPVGVVCFRTWGEFAAYKQKCRRAS